MHRRQSRRRFLHTAGAFGAMTAFSGCVAQATGAQELAFTDRLTMVNWPEYIDDESVALASQSLGIPEFSYLPDYPDNVTGFDEFIEPILSAGATPFYDIITPTNWLAARMINNGWVQELPLEEIPNHINIDPAFLTNDWDRGARFQMPWQGGITGIGYDPNQLGGDIGSISDLFDPALRGQVGLVGEMREAVGLAMLVNGDDPSRPNPASAQAGLTTITNLVDQGHFRFIVFDDFVARLQEGSLAATMAWSGQAAALALEDPRFRYIIPEEGAISWFDTMVIPRNAENARNAARFMNFAYSPVNAARISEFNLYVSPVLGAQSALRDRDPELADNPLIFPDSETRNRLFTWGTLDLEAELEIEAGFDALFDRFDADTLEFLG